MSVIIRLQGLPWSASAMNIRHFFAGLNIPAGGVHIIGGEGGDAFIAFSSDDDARMAMKKNSCPLNGTPVQLFLSSKAEMQSVIDAARAGSSSTTAAPTTPASVTPQSLPPTPAQQQPRQPFSNTSTFPVDNQNPSNGVFAGQQMNDFGQQMQQGQYSRGDWQGFQSYGARMDEQGQPMPNQFMYNQRGPGNQADGRFPSGQGGQGGLDRAPFGNLQQGGQFHDTSGMVPQTGSASMGMGGMYPGADVSVVDPLTQKQTAFGDQIGGRPENIPAASFDNTSLLGNMGRGQGSFPGQLGIGPNRNAFNAGMGKPTPGMDVPGGLLGRMPLGDEPLGRTNLMDDKSFADPMDSMGQSDKFINPLKGESGLAGPDGRKADMMGWGDGQSEVRFQAGHQKMFEPGIHGEKPMINRDNLLDPDGRPFQQFPFRGDPDRGRMNRGLEGPERADPLIDPSTNRLMDRQDRAPSFPGRDVRTGSRFSAAAEPEGRFPADRLPDRFSSERIQPDDMPSTKYPPDNEPQTGAGDIRGHGQFPPVRGRFDDVRYPVDDRSFPPEERFPGDDRRLPIREPGFAAEGDRFPEGDRKFPPGRGFLPDERRHMMDERRFPPGPGARRFPAEEGRFPPDERIGMNPDRMRPDEFPGRRPADNSFAPDDSQFRDREEEPRSRDPYGRGRRGMDDRFPHGGRPDHRPGFRDFEEGEEPRRFPPGPRFPPERPFRGEEGKEDFRAPPAALGERRARVSRWDREQQLDDWQEEGDAYPRPVGPRPPIAEKADFAGVPPEDAGLDEPMDMDQRGGRDHIPGRGGPLEGRRPPLLEGRGGARPHFDVDGRRGPGMEGFRAPLMEGRGHPGEGMRGRGIEGMRGRGMDGMRGRGFDGRGGPGVEGRRGPGIPSLMEENSFDYGHGSLARGRPGPGDVEEDEEFDEPLDYDNRFPGPAARGGMFERPPRGRGEPFFNRGRPGPPFGRGRGLDMDRRFEDSGPDGRMSMDVDARNVGGRPDGPPLRPGFGDKIPDFSVKPGSGKGLLGDAPVIERPVIAKPEPEKKEVAADAFKRDLDNRSARRSDDRDRDNRSSDRRGRDREDRRSGERERSRYKYERDRSDRRRSRSRERGGRDNDGRRSRERSSSNKQDSEVSKSDGQTKNEPKKRCIHLRNLPITAAYKDIKKFLQPLDVPFDGLKMINDKQGKPAGEAFLQFRHHEDASRAFRRHGERLYGKIVSISLCTDEEFSAAGDSSPANKKDTTAPAAAEGQKSEKVEKLRYITQLKNLPLNITKQDIVQFFRGLTVENNNEAVYIEYDQTGVATGNGIVEFKTDFDYKKALTKDGSLLGTVAVRVFPGKAEEADALKQKQLEMLQRAALRNATGPRMMQPGLPGQPPRAQGPPPRLQGQPPRPQGPPQRLAGPPGQMPRPQGQQPRPPGQPRPPLMGPRPGMGPQQPPAATSPGQGNQNRATTPSDSSETVCVHIQGLPLLATPQDIREFFSDCQIAMRGINIAHDSRGKPLGEGFVEFKFKSDFEKAIKKDKTSLGRHIVAVKPIGKKEMVERLDNARGVPVQQSGQGQTPDDQHKPQNQNPAQSGEKQQAPQTPQQGPPAGQNSQGQKPNTPGSGPSPSAPAQGAPVAPGGSKSIPPGVLNKSWYYVRCQNFPPDITIAEILTFFQGLRPIGESIRLHYSSDGKPTGNAVVGFGSSDEAQKALRQLNMKVCRQNIVTLHPA
ncbi:unnamed protein product [Candidula unifasciata]|uniref:RRM domain-containing protein n=1 Tax=Candidula unifasciata TaxID=100452 RepID=A0A8S3YE82_9EUPU|nr:unnamed protein product [Candidula unifasciata]